MKIAVSFLVLVASVVALPTTNESNDELDWSKISPIAVNIEPINPVNTESVELPGGRVIGGTEAPRNAHPYMVACIINNVGLCGCSLISPDRVLTAAHCTIRSSTVQVRLGAHNPQENEATQVRVTSTSIRNHANYNSDTIANDIAVILLPVQVTLNNNIQTIPLAPANSGTFAGSQALLTGWGRTIDASNALSPVLRQVWLSIITNALCRSIYGIFVIDSTICTSGQSPSGNVGGCNGDSGGPLVVNGVQVGIVSFGSELCQAGNPTAYARISAFRTWIQDRRGLNMTS